MAAADQDGPIRAGLRAVDIEQTLGRSAWPSIRSLRVQLSGGVVTLAGYVRSYHEKQVACQEVRRLCGVNEVNDRVEVYYC